MQWCEEGSVMCKKLPGQPSSVHTPKNTVRMSASAGRGPRQSAHKCAQVLGMSNSSVQHILHSDLNLHPYNLQIVHFLRDQNTEVDFQFCRQFQGILNEDPDLPNNLLINNEAHCY